MTNGVLSIDGTEVREGTSLYDTESDRVLWVSDIDEHEIALEALESCEDEATPTGTGAGIEFNEFRSLVESGRLEIGSQPRRT